MSSATRVVTIWSAYGESHLARLEALAEHGFEVVPFAHRDYHAEYPFFRAKPDSLVVVNLSASDRINPFLSWWRTWRLLRIHRPDIVLTAGYERAESFAAWLYCRTSRGRMGGRPVVIIMLDNRFEDHPRSRLLEGIKSGYLRLFDGFLASGNASRDYLRKLGVSASKIELGYDCVDNDKIAMLVARYRAAGQRANQPAGYFLCIGRLIPVKNIPGVIRAYHSYVKLLPDPALAEGLVICGDGPDRREVEELIHRLELGESVSLSGEVIGLEALARQLAFCKALIMASKGDTWGLVVNEAMAAGCPVVVSKQCGCARDLIEPGINGFIFDGEDSDDLTRHLLWLHNNSGLLGAMGAESQEIVRRFTPARFAAGASKLAMSARSQPGDGPNRLR